MYSVVYANLSRVMSPVSLSLNADYVANFVVSYMCYQIKVTWVTEDGKDQGTNFRRELLAKCQNAFETGTGKRDDKERERIQTSIEEAKTVLCAFIFCISTIFSILYNFV